MIRVYLALGSNVGDRQANIKKAIKLLKSNLDDISQAAIYETKPVGYVKQDNFLNTVVSGYTTLTPLELLSFVKSIEKKIGRIDRFKWGPREIDIDIIYYGSRIYKSQELEIPHPRAHERDFVLRPLADLDSNFMHPKFAATSQELLDGLKLDASIVKKL